MVCMVVRWGGEVPLWSIPVQSTVNKRDQHQHEQQQDLSLSVYSLQLWLHLITLQLLHVISLIFTQINHLSPIQITLMGMP